jgi:thiamine biosynthesis lipoprotein
MSLLRNSPQSLGRYFLRSLRALLLFAKYFWAGCPKRLETTAEAMGSTYTLVLYGGNLERMKAAMSAAFDELQRLDHLLSNYRPESDWSKVNQKAATQPVKVCDELYELLQFCVDQSRRSEGTFDITVGPLLKVWGFYGGVGCLPKDEEVAKVLAGVGYRNLLLDETARTVRFARDGVEMDPGGIGKGYAVDRMIAVLRRNGIHSASVSAAGSSIYALGAPPSEPRGWTIKIRDPKCKDLTLEALFLRDMSLSTSGNYEKFFEHKGMTYSHMIDPRSGYPAQGTLEVSVIAANATESEAWTKPFFINGRAWTAAHKPKEVRVFMCEENAPCAWVE